MEPFEPRRISDKVLDIDITDHLIPWGEYGQPMYVNSGGNSLFVPIFSTRDKLREVCEKFGLNYVSIKKIDDPIEFMDCFPESIRFMVDPWQTETGTVRFKEVLR